MRPFPHLQMEQDNLIELCSQYWPGLGPIAKAAHAQEICRLATVISQVREEIIHPWLVDHLSAHEQYVAVVELDLVRVLIHELTASRPEDQLYDALVAVVSDLLRRRFEAEAGEWAGLPPRICASADIRAGDRLRELDQDGRAEGWRPLQPVGLETLRSAVPPGAIPWSDP